MAIDKAIEAAQAEVPPLHFEVKLRSGRVVGVTVPLDFTPLEAVDLVGYIATQLPARLVEAAQRRGPLVAVPPGLRIARG